MLNNKCLHESISAELNDKPYHQVSLSDADILLPFTASSLRDYMLFEQHVIDATRGYVRRFMPGKYKVARLVEKLSGRPFKAFLPKPLWYKHPIYYMGNHLNIVGDKSPVHFPPYSKVLDYELELAAVIVCPLENATVQEAEEAIGGFVVFNDFSARDVQAAEMQSGFGPVKTKNFTNAISPVVVTADELLPRIKNLAGRVRINGKEVSLCSSKDMKYSIGEAIAYASWGEKLHPGELFATGTFPGGSGMETGNWLRHGDTLEVSIDGVGSITSFII